jgi:uncharacterized protein (TIGR02147 family)
VTDPDIYSYTDYRQYLADWLRTRAGRPSLRGFAKKVGCSPAQLSSITNSTRNISPLHADAASAAMGHDAPAHAYFLDLIEFEQASTRPLRRQALDRIMTVRRFRSARRIVDGMYLVFSRWYLPAIVELARCAGFRPDPAWIATTLVPAITLEEANEALDVLVEVGFLVPAEGGALHPAEPTWATEHEEVGRVASVALANLHRSHLSRAAEALDLFNKDERHFGTLALAVPDERVDELKRIVTRFEEEVLSRFASGPEPHRVYQVCVQLFPVSNVTE